MKRLDQYSQHFLRSPNYVKELIGHSNIHRSDTVYDIGAGSGIIAAALAARCKHVVAVEPVTQTVALLRKNMARNANVEIVEASFLDIDLPTAPYKVFSNIPFHLSSPIVRKLTEATNPPEAVYLIVQKQFANKLLPDSSKFTGQLGMMIGPLFAARIRKPLRRTDFSPPPNVDTVLLELLRRPGPLLPVNEMPSYRKFIEGCFSTPAIFAKTPRTAIGLPADIKPSQMRLAEWVKLYRASTTKKSR